MLSISPNAFRGSLGYRVYKVPMSHQHGKLSKQSTPEYPLETPRLTGDKLRQLFGQNGSFRLGAPRGDAEPRSSKLPQIFESVL